MTFPSWIKCSPPPHSVFGTLLPLNTYEFIIVPQAHPNDKRYKDLDGIYKYNSIHKQWSKIFDYPDLSYFTSVGHRSAIDIKNQIVYACSRSKLLKIDLNTKTMKIIYLNYYVGNFPGTIFANDSLHIIGGVLNNSHWILDKSTLMLNEAHNFEDDDQRIASKAIYFKRHKSILSTCSAFEEDGKIRATSITEFKNNKWNIFKDTQDKELFNSSIIATKNENYLIFVSGGNFNSIFVYDVRKDVMIKSDIKKPTNDFSCVIITRNDDRDNLLTFGFVGECYKKREYKNIQKLPFYLIKMIDSWVCFETVHLLIDSHGVRCEPRTHWTIDVDKIITPTITK